MPKSLKPLSVPVGYSFDKGTGTLFLLGYNKSMDLGHALVVNNGETTVAVSISGRQDFATAWGVMVAECDGDVLVKSGLTKPHKDPVKAVNKALRKLVPGCCAGRARREVYEEVDEDRLGFGTDGENDRPAKRRSVRIKKPKPEFTVESAGSIKGGVMTNVPVAEV